MTQASAVTALVSDFCASASRRGPSGIALAAEANSPSLGVMDVRMDLAAGEPQYCRAIRLRSTQKRCRSVLASGVHHIARTCRVIRQNSALAVDRLVENLLGV